jgi:DNA-binding NtrC family response regulator
MSRILVVDDQSDVRAFLARLLGQKHSVTAVEGGAEAIERCLVDPPDCVLLDYDMPEMNGLEVLGRLLAIDAAMPVIMLTGVVDLQLAITCLKQGAYDYLTKPPEWDELEAVVARAIEKRGLLSQVSNLQGELRRVYGIESIVGRHTLMREVFELIGRVAPRHVSVLIEGPSGTGKELVARAIHHHHGGSEGRPFVALNCAAIPDGLMEAELFGHEKGAFTDAKSARSGVFEQADGGTLFLDEVGDLNLTNQAKVLRVLQEREVVRLGGGKPRRVDVRIIAATNRDLEAMVAEGRFREDLYYRIHVVPIRLPPLRERASDIPLLLGHFVSRTAALERIPPKQFDPDALRKLQAYPWPGNVRELENLVERLMALVSGEVITCADLPRSISGAPETIAGHFDAVMAGELSLTEAVDRFERQVLEAALQLCDGNKSAAAERIGITRRILRYKLVKLGLEEAAAGDDEAAEGPSSDGVT